MVFESITTNLCGYLFNFFGIIFFQILYNSSNMSKGSNSLDLSYT